MRHRQRGERGFALLIVFVMAAAISIGLYLELPRSVFESQRAKEELLFDRGEQYKMGIKRYFTKFQRYPASIEQLEETSGVRYLRRRYKDPFTGKDDWKILKFGPDGQIEGSVHNKKKTGLENEKDPKANPSVVALPSLGDQPAPGESVSRTGANGEDTNPALNRRPSDTGIGAQLANAQNQASQLPPGQEPPQYLGINGTMPNPNLAPPVGVPNPNLPQLPNVSTNNGSTFTGSQQNSGLPGQMTQAQYQQQQMQLYQQQYGGVNGLGGGNRLPNGQISTPFPGLPGQAANSQTGGQLGTPIPGVNGTGTGTGTSNGLGNNPNPALNMINQLLTQPRQGVAVGQLAGGALGGAMPTGIAGVASKHRGQGIKVLDERTKIHEWEFVYDMKKDKSLQKGAMAPQRSGTLPGSGLSNSSGMGNNTTK